MLLTTATVRVVVMALHSNGQEYANRYIQQAASAAQKKIKIDWLRFLQLEDRKGTRCYVQRAFRRMV